MITTTVQADPKLQNLIDNLGKVDQVVRPAVWDNALDMSYEMEAQIKDEMPRDTGRAAASWGHFTPEDLREGKKITKSKRITKRSKFSATGETGRAQIASPADAIWEEDESNLSVTQGTRVNYVEQLNEGHSDQAPAGFLDRAIDRTQSKFSQFGEALGKMIAEVLEGRGPTSIRQSFRMRVPGTGERRTFRI